MSGADGGKVQRLGNYVADAKGMDPELFAMKHGDAFFLHFGSIENLRPPARAEGTVMVEVGSSSPARGFNPQQDFLVFPFRLQTPEDGRGTLVWVGRGGRNNVVIPDASVSSIQAFIRDEGEQVYSLQDMRSANGSYINDDRVPELGLGDPMRFRSGDRIRFGLVELTFLLARDFHVLVKKMG
jgi:hypothetical protein